MTNPIPKHIYTGSTWVSSTYYVRDASGNVMANYASSTNNSSLSYKVTERPIYGSSRAGLHTQPIELIGYTPTNHTTREIGHKQFEITNHLGNVMAIIVDAKTRGTANGVVTFSTQVLGVNDYWGFGAVMGERHVSASGYRYGFNGKERTDEVSGSGVSYDYGFRIYDARLGKFMSVDPLSKKFPMLTPYQFASNTPIWAVDLDGLEARVYNDISFPIGHTFISVIDEDGVIHVYTYGQYGEGNENSKISPIGQGALVHLKGDAANEYIKSEFEKYGNKFKVYEISDKVADKQAIIDFYSQQMKNGKPATSKNEVVELANQNRATGSEAIKYKLYSGLPDGTISENCVSVTQDALRAGSSSILPYTSKAIPQDINFGLWLLSIISSNYSEVTQDAKAKAEMNMNGTISE